MIPTEDLLIDRSLRLSISALQVLFLTGIYALLVSVSTILHVIRKSSPLAFSRLELEDMREQSWVHILIKLDGNGAFWGLQGTVFTSNLPDMKLPSYYGHLKKTFHVCI